jgi:hypothetical protein
MTYILESFTEFSKIKGFNLRIGDKLKNYKNTGLNHYTFSIPDNLEQIDFKFAEKILMMIIIIILKLF